MSHKKAVKKRFIVKLILLGFVIFLVFAVVQILDYSLTRPVTITNISEEAGVAWQIDMVRVDRNFTAVTGWAFIVGQAPSDMAIKVVLQNTETKESLELPTTLTVRDDINDQYTDDIDYSKAGFLSRVNNQFLDLEGTSYDIYIKLISRGQLVFIKTDQVVSKP
ncbi:MAG: hypothetical protein RQ728_08090 [Brevefilum sp.]|nr:hypothetical protein [Brevefilum sp.]MDT8382198.1 hypothetical protein [Brevefilum sp.]MDW7754826.1 hypothetical protein [Brevefilum sp.]